ncbi:unnamed protein product, partial [Amoebophrya sp. A25]|eukprot:GSA25T00007661001.1
MPSSRSYSQQHVVSADNDPYRMEFSPCDLRTSIILDLQRLREQADQIDAAIKRRVVGLTKGGRPGDAGKGGDHENEKSPASQEKAAQEKVRLAGLLHHYERVRLSLEEEAANLESQLSDMDRFPGLFDGAMDNVEVGSSSSSGGGSRGDVVMEDVTPERRPGRMDVLETDHLTGPAGGSAPISHTSCTARASASSQLSSSAAAASNHQGELCQRVPQKQFALVPPPQATKPGATTFSGGRRGNNIYQRSPVSSAVNPCSKASSGNSKVASNGSGSASATLLSYQQGPGPAGGAPLVGSGACSSGGKNFSLHQQGSTSGGASAAAGGFGTTPALGSTSSIGSNSSIRGNVPPPPGHSSSMSSTSSSRPPSLHVLTSSTTNFHHGLAGFLGGGQAGGAGGGVNSGTSNAGGGSSGISATNSAASLHQVVSSRNHASHSSSSMVSSGSGGTNLQSTPSLHNMGGSLGSGSNQQMNLGGLQQLGNGGSNSRMNSSASLALSTSTSVRNSLTGPMGATDLLHHTSSTSSTGAGSAFSQGGYSATGGGTSNFGSSNSLGKMSASSGSHGGLSQPPALLGSNNSDVGASSSYSTTSHAHAGVGGAAEGLGSGGFDHLALSVTANGGHHHTLLPQRATDSVSAIASAEPLTLGSARRGPLSSMPAPSSSNNQPNFQTLGSTQSPSTTLLQQIGSSSAPANKRPFGVSVNLPRSAGAAGHDVGCNAADGFSTALNNNKRRGGPNQKDADASGVGAGSLGTNLSRCSESSDFSKKASTTTTFRSPSPKQLLPHFSARGTPSSALHNSPLSKFTKRYKSSTEQQQGQQGGSFNPYSSLQHQFSQRSLAGSSQAPASARFSANYGSGAPSVASSSRNSVNLRRSISPLHQMQTISSQINFSRGGLLSARPHYEVSSAAEDPYTYGSSGSSTAGPAANAGPSNSGMGKAQPLSSGVSRRQTPRLFQDNLHSSPQMIQHISPRDRRMISPGQERHERSPFGTGLHIL